MSSSPGTPSMPVVRKSRRFMECPCSKSATVARIPLPVSIRPGVTQSRRIGTMRQWMPLCHANGGRRAFRDREATEAGETVSPWRPRHPYVLPARSAIKSSIHPQGLLVEESILPHPVDVFRSAGMLNPVLSEISVHEIGLSFHSARRTISRLNVPDNRPLLPGDSPRFSQKCENGKGSATER